MYDNYNLCTKEKQNAYLFAINKIHDENTSIVMHVVGTFVFQF